MEVEDSVKEAFSSEVDTYWINRNVITSFACPNVSLFRLIGSAIGNLDNKKILEVGFAHGADLIECKRRGADIVGLDLNPKFVINVKQTTNCDVRQFRAGTDLIPFEQPFDLIYSNDTIYYLNDDELKQFLEQCSTKMKAEGSLIVQFIETDLKRKDNVYPNRSSFDLDFLSQYLPHQIHNEDNPIRFLDTDKVVSIAKDSNLKLVGSKRMLQSYDLNESEIRVEKYLIFCKQ